MAQPGQCEPEHFPHQTEHNRRPTCESQTSLSPSLTSPAREAQAHSGFHISSSRIQWPLWVTDVPINSIYQSSITKRQLPWHPYSPLYRIFQAPNPSLLTQACPVSLFSGRCHLLIFLQSGTVWPPHSRKLEVPSFTQKAWKMLWFTAILMSEAFLDL